MIGREGGSVEEVNDGPRSLSKYVYSHLLGRIRNGDIKPGERLTEVDLARQLGVSRTPVREAFKGLHARRLLNVVPGRGMELVQLDASEVGDLYDLRATLEGMAASLAAERASRPSIDALYASVAYYEQNIDNVAILPKANREFHHVIYAASENAFLQDALYTLEDTLGLVRGGIQNSAARRRSIVDEHRAIADAIAKRDNAAAESIARHHDKEAMRYRLRVTTER